MSPVPPFRPGHIDETKQTILNGIISHHSDNIAEDDTRHRIDGVKADRDSLLMAAASLIT
jgi:hypothetical protein